MKQTFLISVIISTINITMQKVWGLRHLDPVRKYEMSQHGNTEVIQSFWSYCTAYEIKYKQNKIKTNKCSKMEPPVFPPWMQNNLSISPEYSLSEPTLSGCPPLEAPVRWRQFPFNVRQGKRRSNSVFQLHLRSTQTSAGSRICNSWVPLVPQDNCSNSVPLCANSSCVSTKLKQQHIISRLLITWLRKHICLHKGTF